MAAEDVPLVVRQRQRDACVIMLPGALVVCVAALKGPHAFFNPHGQMMITARNTGDMLGHERLELVVK
jgi:hypothetical protein